MTTSIDIQPHAAAPDGTVQALPAYSKSDFPASAAILCRNTAPLVSFAFSLISRGVGCKVLGREIGQGLVTLVKKLNAISLDDLDKRLDMYETREVARFRRKDDEQAADSVRDRVSCIRLFLENSAEGADVDDLCRRISALFDDNASGLLTLSTIHKAKGLEWPTVFILDGWRAARPLMPSPFAKLPWQRQQEINLIYVAITRAKLDLRYIESGCWINNKPKSASEALADQD